MFVQAQLLVVCVGEDACNCLQCYQYECRFVFKKYNLVLWYEKQKLIKHFIYRENIRIDLVDSMIVRDSE